MSGGANQVTIADTADQMAIDGCMQVLESGLSQLQPDEDRMCLPWDIYQPARELVVSAISRWPVDPEADAAWVVKTCSIILVP